MAFLSIRVSRFKRFVYFLESESWLRARADLDLWLPLLYLRLNLKSRVANRRPFAKREIAGTVVFSWIYFEPSLEKRHGISEDPMVHITRHGYLRIANLSTLIFPSSQRQISYYHVVIVTPIKRIEYPCNTHYRTLLVFCCDITSFSKRSLIIETCDAVAIKFMIHLNSLSQ